MRRCECISVVPGLLGPGEKDNDNGLIIESPLVDARPQASVLLCHEEGA